MRVCKSEKAGESHLSRLGRIASLVAIIFLYCFIFTFPYTSFAWGPGHDTVARCILKKLPDEWRNKFKNEWMETYLAASHLPDNGDLLILRPADVEWLQANCGLKENAFNLHYAPCLLGEVSLLVHAIRTGDDYSVFMYLASISHSLADPAACNHDPIIHSATYIWGEEGFDILPNTGRPLPVDFAFTEHDSDTKAVLERRLAELEVPKTPDNTDEDDFFAKLLSWEYFASEPCHMSSQKILENGSRWMMTGDVESKCAAADALCNLGLWGVSRTLQVFAAACAFAAKGEVEITPERIELLCAAAKINETVAAQRSMDGDSFARPYFADAGRPVRFAILYDPTRQMSSSVFAVGGQTLGCQVVGTLKRISPDLNAGLRDVREFVQKGLNPSVTPYVMVFTHVTAWRGFDVKAFHDRLKDYKQRGGKVVWVDGMPPEYILGPAVTATMTDDDHHDEYCKPAFQVPLDEIMSCSLALLESDNEKVWSYKRKPTGKAGWYWHGSPWHFDVTKLPPNVKPIVELRTPEGTFTTGVFAPGVAYIPYNSLFPYCLTEEVPSFLPFRLSLDSAGEAVLLAILKELRK